VINAENIKKRFETVGGYIAAYPGNVKIFWEN
jgi:hypothetical protein